MYNNNLVGYILEQTTAHPDANDLTNDYKPVDLSIEVDSLQNLEQREHEARVNFLSRAGVRILDTRSQLRPIPQEQREYYMTDSYMAKIANALPDHHRIEQLAAAALRELGLDARALAPVIDGDTSNKKADIVINLPCSEFTRSMGCTDKRDAEDNCFHQVAIEVKRAHGKNAALGLPLHDNDEFATEGFDRYPKWLYVDSVKAWADKTAWHSRRGVPLLGAIVACNIVELSDEDTSVLGLLYLPCNGTWVKKDTCNPSKGTLYTAWTAKGNSNILPLRALADQLAPQN